MHLWGRILVSLQGICLTTYLSSSAELRPSLKRRMITSGREQDSRSTALVAHQQPIRRKPRTPQPSPQILPIKTAPWKPWEKVRALSMSHPFSARGPFPAPSPQVWVCPASLCAFLGTWTCVLRWCLLHGFNSKSYKTGVCPQGVSTPPRGGCTPHESTEEQSIFFSGN